MKRKSTLAILCATVFLALLVAEAHANVIVPQQGIYLRYSNGTYVFLPQGNYSSVYQKNLQWYVNGQPYSTPTPNPTAPSSSSSTSPNPTAPSSSSSTSPNPTASPFDGVFPTSTPTYSPAVTPSPAKFNPEVIGFFLIIIFAAIVVIAAVISLLRKH